MSVFLFALLLCAFLGEAAGQCYGTYPWDCGGSCCVNGGSYDPYCTWVSYCGRKWTCASAGKKKGKKKKFADEKKKKEVTTP